MKDIETENRKMVDGACARGSEAFATHEGREGAFGARGDTVRGRATKTPRRGQRIEKRGNFNAGDAYLAKKCPELAKYGLIPAAFDPADPSSIQTAAELRRRIRCLELQVTVLANLLGVTVVYVVLWKGVFA